jgi:hypothetical protein
MKIIKYKNITIKLYQDPMEFANSDEKPFGNIIEGATFGGVVDIITGKKCKSTGFTTLDNKTIFLYVDPTCDFKDCLSTVSHEMGHIIEGGFKKNPPNSTRYNKRHEQKAEHYENFTMSCYNLTKRIITKNIKKQNKK